MSSTAARRRSRPHIETEEEADLARFGERSSSPLPDGPKRMRLRGGRGAPGRIADEDEEDQGSSDEYHSYPDGDSDLNPSRTNGSVTTNGASKAEFSPGAIVRVKVENFVTYEKAEFFPGPNLNMVIGPNGTGKSSLVCAICLGLGYPASTLGRATSFGDFVKHGKESAIVEIELQKRLVERENYIVKLKINREDNSRKFSMNGKEVPHKSIQSLMQKLRIQIDNLCQFLPQEKVAEFAGLDSVELLSKTLQAAAPREMMEQQGELKKMFGEHKAAQRQLEVYSETLRSEETRQQGLQADVDRLREREQIQKVVADLEDTRLVVNYNEKKERFNEFRDRKKKALARQRRLEQEVAPSLEDVNLKSQYHHQILAVLEARERRAKEAEQEANKTFADIDRIDEKIQNVENKRKAEKNSLDSKRKQISQARTKITSLEGMHRSANKEIRELNAPERNHKIREKTRERDSLRDEMQEANTRKEHVISRGKAKAQEKRSIQQSIKNLDSQQGQRYLQLKRLDNEIASGWEWLQEHQSEFEKEVFGPPMLTCSIKDKRYSNYVQSVLQKDDFLCFTAQTKNDHKKLTDQLFKNMKLGVTVRTIMTDLSSFRSPISQEGLKDMGLDGYALNFVEGPEPVLAMLCSEKRLHLTGVALSDVNEEQYQKITDGETINSFAAGSTMYRINRRREYGPGATSTVSRAIQPGRFWTDEPVDIAAKNELEQKLGELSGEMTGLTAQIREANEKLAELKGKEAEIQQEVTRLEQEKASIQREHNQWKALPDKIDVEKNAVTRMLDDLRKMKQTLVSYDDETERLQLEKARLALRCKEQLGGIRDANQALLEARMRFIEASSDVAALKERNSGIVQRLEEERRKFEELARQVERVKAEAREAHDACTELFAGAEEENRERRGFLIGLAEGKTVESITEDIETENAKLDLIHAADPGVLQDFETRAARIESLHREKAKKDGCLEELNQKMQDLRARWEPALDDIIRRINDAFSYNFEQINCAGEVGVHKDEEFEKWAIEIKVKFREHETLQKLDQHRQSGGERAVSTIFYLMSLQSMAQSPFRVVDEINQGMDPRNERMVHERMVQIACNEHTSQYFLITPKLLSGLRYDPRMKVLCIASGEYMPEEGGKLDFSRCVEIKKRLLAAAASA